MGFVFQFFNLLPTLTAEENVALPLIIDAQDLRKHQERIHYLINLVGLGDRTHKLRRLGGEQQRVSIARASSPSPPSLADEPTGNLDSKTGKAIMERSAGRAMSRSRPSSWSPTTRGPPPMPTVPCSSPMVASPVRRCPTGVATHERLRVILEAMERCL